MVNRNFWLLKDVFKKRHIKDQISSRLYADLIATKSVTVISDKLSEFCLESNVDVFGICEIYNKSFQSNFMVAIPEIIRELKIESLIEEEATNIADLFDSDKNYIKLRITSTNNIFKDNFESPKQIYIFPIAKTNARIIISLISFAKEKNQSEKKILFLHNLSYFVFSRVNEIRNYDLYTKRVDSGGIIAKELKKTMSSRTIGLNLDKFMHALELIFPVKCNCIVMWLYNQIQYESGKELVLRYLSFVKPDKLIPTYLDLDNSLTGRAVKESKPFYYENVLNEKLYQTKEWAKKKGLKKLIVCPLFNSENLPVGALNLYPSDSFIVSDSFFKVLDTFVGSIELAIESYEMQEKLFTLNNVLSFYKKADRLSSDKQFFNKLIFSFTKQEIIGVEGASIFLVDENSKKLVLAATTGVKEPWKIGDKAYNFGEGLTGQVAKRKESIIENNLEKAKNSRSDKVLEITKTVQKTWIGTPIFDKTTNELLGVIRCVNKIRSDRWPFSFFTILDQRILEFVSFITAQIILGFKILKSKEDALREQKTAYARQEEFIRSISHEINIPVNSILGRLQLLKDAFPKGYDAKSKTDLWFDDIEAECFHIEMLSRTHSAAEPYFERVNIFKDIILRVKYVLERISKSKHIDIDYNYPSKRVPSCLVDKTRLLQVMYNIVSNAIKYSFENTVIDINADMQFNNTLIVSISNEGIGIPENYKEKIFEKYIRTKEAKQYHPTGTGVGLYYCKEIIAEDHGGQIWFERDNKKTIFKFSIPPDRFI